MKMANGEQWRNKGFSIKRINLIAAPSCIQALLMGLVQSIILMFHLQNLLPVSGAGAGTSGMR